MRTSSVSPSISLGVIILAAGRSRRMGRPKLLLPWGATSVLGHLLAQWRRLEARQIAVVCAVGDATVLGELDRLEFPLEHRIFNPEPDRGMFSSIQCAARWPGWQGALTHWAVVLGDQPHLRHETLRTIVDFCGARPERVCQPRRAGHGRHPVLLPKPAFARLANSDARDLKVFLAGANPAFCELNDPGLDLDLDSPADYEKALSAAKESAAGEES